MNEEFDYEKRSERTRLYELSKIFAMNSLQGNDNHLIERLSPYSNLYQNSILYQLVLRYFKDNSLQERNVCNMSNRFQSH
jgi:hypothetical protein